MSRIARWFGIGTPAPPPTPIMAAPILETVVADLGAQSPAHLWRTQPHLRTVVDFLARSVASLGMHAYRHADDGGRDRLRTGPLAELMQRPNRSTTGYEFIRAIVGDLALYDRAYVYIGRAADDTYAEGWTLRPIPPTWITGTVPASPFDTAAYKLTPPATSETITVPTANMVEFHGWNPIDPRTGASPIDALKAILAEQVSAQTYRRQRWDRGGRVDAYLTRPADAPPWPTEARERFAREWRDQYAGDRGSNAGGTPLLEDGMRLERLGFSARDDQYVEASRLSLETVAQVYHVNPTMIGQLQNANYSNVREFRRSLYGDTLGPLITEIEQRLNAFMVPKVTDDPRVYLEMNVKAKLRGSFEEQAAIMQTAVGAPWMTINEARARENMTALDDGDELIRPLNVTANGDKTPIPAEPEATEA